jgi:cystine transport system substrate-binding protein
MVHAVSLHCRQWLAAAGLATALGTALVTFMLPAGASDLLDAVKARGTLRVGMEGTYPPFNYLDPATGLMTGYDADVARLVGAGLGVKVALVSAEWSEMFQGLEAGRYDVIINQVSMTPQRQRVVDFSRPYTYSASQLILRKNDDHAYLVATDLKGKTIGVAKGSAYEMQARAIPGAIVRSYPAAPEHLQDLAFGRIDAVLNDSLLVAWLVHHSPLPLKAGPLVGTTTQMGVALRKGNPALKAAIDQALLNAEANGSLGKLSRTWFGVDASRPAR